MLGYTEAAISFLTEVGEQKGRPLLSFWLYVLEPEGRAGFLLPGCLFPGSWPEAFSRKNEDDTWLALHLYRQLLRTEQSKPILKKVMVRQEVVVTKNDWKIIKLDRITSKIYLILKEFLIKKSRTNRFSKNKENLSHLFWFEAPPTFSLCMNVFPYLYMCKHVKHCIYLCVFLRMYQWCPKWTNHYLFNATQFFGLLESDPNYLVQSCISHTKLQLQSS